jgi:hypothetical protein
LWVSLYLQELSCDSLQFRFIVCYCPLLDAISVSKLRFRLTFICSIFALGDILKISDCIVCLVCDGQCGRNGGCTGLSIVEGFARVGGGIKDLAIAKALAEKASIAAFRRQRKDDRLSKEVDSAKRKALHQTQGVEDSSRKRAREKETISFYFRRSRNFDPDETGGGVTGRSPLTGSGLEASTALESHALLQGNTSLDAASIAAIVTSSEDIEVIGGSEPSIMLSTDSSAYCLSEDNPNWHAFHNVPLNVLEEESKEEDFLDLPPPPKKTQKNYEVTRKFQMDWSAKCPWSEMILSRDGLLHMVKCSICTVVRGRPVIMGPKWDTIWHHGKRKCYLKNTELYAVRRPTSVLQQIQGCNTLESRKKVRYTLTFDLLLMLLYKCPDSAHCEEIFEILLSY